MFKEKIIELVGNNHNIYEISFRVILIEIDRNRNNSIYIYIEGDSISSHGIFFNHQNVIARLFQDNFLHGLLKYCGFEIDFVKDYYRITSESIVEEISHVVSRYIFFYNLLNMSLKTEVELDSLY